MSFNKFDNGIEMLKDSTIDYKEFVDEIREVVPSADSELKSKLDKTSLALKELLKELLKYC